MANRPTLDGANILITGASSGIGEAMSRQLAPRAATLVLVARRAERLHALKAELTKQHPTLEVHVAPCDLTDSVALEAMLDELEATVGPIDILINNAGVGDIALFDETSIEKLERMIQLNVVALTRLTHQLVPAMAVRHQGGVLNVSSGFGLAFMPGAATYAATKHYVTAFTESLRIELAASGVAISQVCPGPVATEFESIAGNPIGHSVPAFVELSPEQCAREALRAFEKGRALVVPGKVVRVLMWLNAMTPRWVLRIVLRPVVSLMRGSKGKTTEASSG